MRHLVMILLAVLFGLALGLGGTIIELGASPDGRIQHDLQITSSAGPVDLHRPHVAIEKTEYDFGSMERGLTQVYAFPVKNDGGEPLTMEKTSVSCGMCIVSVHFTKMPIPPGESAEAEITWKATSMGPFRHHANVRTNDPSRPEVQFNIVGKVMNSFRVSPEQLVLNGASATNSTTAELRIYSYRGEDVEVTSHKFLNDETKDKFSVEVKPLTAEQLKEDGEAKGGVAVFVSTKPGLTVGRLAQQLELTLNLPKNPVVDVPIEAVVSSAVKVVGDGQGWDAERSLLNLEMVNRHEGKKVELTLLASGPHAKDLNPTLKTTSPDVFKVSFGQRKELAAGHFVQVPMTIEIPAGSRPAVHLGGKQGEMGEIVIATGHPEATTMRIPVRFGIGD